MKKSISGVLLGAGIIFANLLHAQTELSDTNLDWNSASDLEVELSAIEMTTPSPATDVPQLGTFWSAQHAPGSPEAWPPLPGNVNNAPAWNLGDGVFLLSDENFDYDAPLQAKPLRRSMSALDLSPAGGGAEEDDLFSPSFSFASSTNLWLAITNLASNTAGLVLSNTVGDVQYEIQGTTNLTGTNWNSYGFVSGSELTNWTPTSITATDYPNLFLRVRSWQDSDNSGLPDWWQLQNFGHTGIDPNGNPAGDGWSNVQKFQNGMNPNLFYTPPAPQGFTAVYNAANGKATVSWLPSPGPVTGYTVTDSDGNTFNFSASTNGFIDNLSSDTPDLFTGDLNTTLQIQAHYAGGDSAVGGPIPVELNAITASIIAGPQGSAYVAVSALPTGTTALRVLRVDEGAILFFGDDSANTNFDLPVTNLNNGLYLIPPAFVKTPPDNYGFVAYNWFVKTINTNGDVSVATPCFNLNHVFPLEDSHNYVWLVPPYFDGRAQLKQNLIFLLRSAVVDLPFAYKEFFTNGGSLVVTNPVSYVYADFSQPNHQGMGVKSLYFDVYAPFYNNYLYRNFVFDSSDLNSSGYLQTGVGGSFDTVGYLTLSTPPTYQFAAPATNGTPISAVLATNNTRWLASYPLDSSAGYLDEIGVTNSAGTYFMFSNARNYWGLPLLSTEIAYGSSSEITLFAGGNTTQGGKFYPETTQPQLQTVAYDFWNADSVTNFPASHINDLLVASVGDPKFAIAGYAKLAVTNGYSGVYGYLAQYFDKAYQITDGVMTTNQTGVLSPYGSFFATQPVPVALVTMPDVDTGARGTATVYCVSLNVDKNHDGNLDLSFSGADATSASNPFQFWANNNYDRGHTVDGSDFEQDDLDVQYGYAGSTKNPMPDYNYTVGGNRMIPCARDLEDFSRLWISGVTSNLLAALPSGSTITLNWGDEGSPNAANPTIDLFIAADTNGGIGYLTNITIAAQQTNITQCPYVGRIAPGDSLQLNTIQFSNFWAGNHFIWCGVSNGTGGLNLTIADASGNVLAQTTTYIQIVDIKQMYERWTVGDNGNITPLNTATNAQDGLLAGETAFHYGAATTNTPYILFVHGWNMQYWEKDRYAETAFKRLYWQGYQGRFGEFRWPTYTSFFLAEFSLQAINPRNFDNSESNAWASAPGLLNKLSDLNTQYPGQVYLMAHSMGNVVAGEALRLAGTNHIVNTYIAMQAAMSAHAYDPATATRNSSASTPDDYAHYWTNGAPCYFNVSTGAGTYVNFFNTNDWALTGLWPIDQDAKPDNSITGYPGYHYSVSSLHTNGFYVQFGSGTNDFQNLNFPGDTYTIFSYCDQARSYALGAQAGVAGVFTTTKEINLSSDPYDFVNTHKFHSGEFRSDNAQRWFFWNTVLIQMRLK